MLRKKSGLYLTTCFSPKTESNINKTLTVLLVGTLGLILQRKMLFRSPVAELWLHILTFEAQYFYITNGSDDRVCERVTHGDETTELGLVIICLLLSLNSAAPLSSMKHFSDFELIVLVQSPKHDKL